MLIPVAAANLKEELPLRLRDVRVQGFEYLNRVERPLDPNAFAYKAVGLSGHVRRSAMTVYAVVLALDIALVLQVAYCVGQTLYVVLYGDRREQATGCHGDSVHASVRRRRLYESDLSSV